MTSVEHLFLQLLKPAIWDHQVDTSLFHNLTLETWLEIEAIAQKQSVLGLVANKILELPKDCLPPRDMRLRLLLKIQMIEQLNKKLNQALAELKADYDKEGFPFVLIKGQSLAYYYPNPLLRSSGDIDVYLYKEGDYERANKWTKASGYRLQGSASYEQLYWRGKVAVENHLLLIDYGREKYDKALANLLAPFIRDNAFARLELEGHSYEVLPTELNAVYIFIHILHHFSYLGIGLRQICDWLIFLKHHIKVIDLERFYQMAESLDLLRPMKLFALMGVRHLGAKAEDLPFDLPKDKKSARLADLILEDVFYGGNFGFENFTGRTFFNVWTRRLFMFRKSVVRSWKIGAVSPEHIRLTPFIGAMTRLKLTIKELFH